MEDEIQKYLQRLNNEEILRKSQEAEVIINQIRECFTYEQSQFTSELLVALVLDESDGIFSFIWKTCSNEETVPSTIAAFKLLFFLVTKLQKCTEPYFCTIYEKCLYLFDLDSGKVKELSLKLVLSLITVDSKITFDLSKLVSAFQKYLNEDNKIRATVLKKVFEILGFLFEKYPEVIKSQEKWFFNKMIGCLQDEKTGGNTSQSKIRGACEGINGYLMNFKPSKESLNCLYDYIKKRSQEKKKPLFVLKIFANHWTHFPELIYSDREKWEKNLSDFLHNNPESRKSVFQSYLALYSAIAYFTKQSSETIENYLRDFIKDLQSSNSNFHEKTSALIGIKIFILADGAKEDTFKKIFNTVVIFTNNEIAKGFFLLSSCIECLSALILKASPNDRLNFEPTLLLKKASVKLLENFPKIDVDFQQSALISLEKTFYTLNVYDSLILHNYIENVLYQALVITFSCITVVDFEMMKETEIPENDLFTYKSYLSLWKYLLTLSNSTVEDSFENKKEVTVKIFDTVIDSFIKIMSKLNFNVCITPLNFEVEAEIEKPSDFQIFMNCVDWYHDLVPLLDFSCLSKWVVKIFEVVINLSHKNPLVAGFYKIIIDTLKVIDGFQLFETDGKKLRCFEILKSYIEEILVKIDHNKGELQIVCLQTLLAAPTTVIESFVEKTIPALEMAVQLGRSHFPLLMDLMETLERWNLYLPSQTMADVMQKVLPQFDIFFQSQYFQGNNLVASSIVGKKLKTKLVFNDSEILIFQKKFLSFLGSLDLNTAINLIEQSKITQEEKQITDKRLICHLPFTNGKTEIDLDEVLPRIIELALSCSDRRTRITACESLYSSVVFLLGSINQVDGIYRGLFKKVIRASLVLGSDCDPIVCQIFEPLMVQITHYFSGKKAVHFVETQDLIEILVEYVTRPYDPAVRDFSAALISEFTSWCIKQFSLEELKDTPFSVTKIMCKIYSLALHPSYSKRLGAAVIFNKIYSIILEEDYILDSNWFQLFYYFMESLRMCSELEDTTEIIEAIQHVKKPLVEKHKIFKQMSGSRIVPSEFEGGLLCDLITWTLKRCSHEKTLTRRIAMTLVLELSPLIEDSNFLKSAFKKIHPKQLFSEEEKVDVPNLKEADFIKWLNRESAHFEYYAWLLDKNIVSMENVSFSGFIDISKNYILGIMPSSNKFFTAESSKNESVLLFLNLLLALKERAFYFPIEIWEMLKILVFKPCKLGVEINNSEISQNFLTALSTLLKYCSVNLPQYNNFYKNLEGLMTFPILYRITRSRCLNNESLEFLFALKVIENSEIWEEIANRTCFSLNGNIIVQIVFQSLFFKEKEKCYAILLDPSCKMYLEELMTIASKVRIEEEQLLKFIEDEEEVLDGETNKILKKGKYFLMKFESCILRILKSQGSFLVENALKKKTVNAIQFLIHVIESKEAEEGDLELPREVFRRWEEFEKLEINENCAEKKNLLHLAICAAQAIGSPGCFKDSAVEERIYGVLENQKIEEMEIDVIRSFFILFSFMPNFEEKLEENLRLEKALSKFLIEPKVFQCYSNQGGANFEKLGVVVNGLLNSLKKTGSLTLFKFILGNAMWFETILNKEIDDALIVFQNVSESHSLRALTLAYNCCFEFEQCKTVISQIYYLFLLPLMSRVSDEVKYEFVVENLENLSRTIYSRSTGGEKSLSVVRCEILRKICCVGILETFVKELPVEKLNKIPPEKKTIIDEIVKNCFFLLKGPPPVRALKERHRKLMCGIFNMICAIISTRCTEEKFYKYFIFDDRGSFLYEAVDKKFKYNFDMTFDEIPKRKKLLTSVRNCVKNKLIIDQNKMLNSIKYVQTNNLFNSSLQEDITKFDFTFATVRPTDSVKGYEAQNHVVEVELEADSFNNHECMATLVGIIAKMVQDNIAPLPVDEETVNLPCWLQFFLSSLKNSKLSANIKLFVLKALYNVQNFVEPYSGKIFPEVLEFVLYFFEKHPLNYFLIDLIEMMTCWRPLPEGDVPRGHLTNLMKMVICKSDSIRKDIVKFNLEIIKAMTENWKEVIFTSELSKLITERVSEVMEFDRNTSDGIPYLYVHICEILLSNGISPWSSGSEDNIFNFLLSHLNEENKHRQIFAETCGLALNYLQEMSRDASEKYEKLVNEKINEIASWVPVLYAIHKRCPGFSYKFAEKLFNSVSSLSDSFLGYNLEMLLTHFSKPEILDNDAINFRLHSFIVDMLNLNDVYVQELSLQIADKVFENLKGENLKLLMKEVFRLQKSVHPEVRKWVYKIAIKYYPQCCSDFNEKKQCKIVLLKGLNDNIEELENICFMFWKDFLCENFTYLTPIKVLQEMYMPETEGISLSNTSKLIIESAAMISQGGKFFSLPVDRQSKFQKRSLILNTRGRHVSDFMSNQIFKNQSLEYVATIKSQHTLSLKPGATTLKFDPTVEEDIKDTFVDISESKVRNPLKHRFYKRDRAEKTNFSFAKWQSRKKTEEIENEKGRIIKKNTQVEIYGEYSMGDYPDVQLSYTQILKPLGALVKKDPQVRRQFLVSFYTGLVESVNDGEKATLMSEMNKYFENIMTTSTVFDSGVFGFSLQFLFKYGDKFRIDCGKISNAAISSNWLFLGALVIEQIIVKAEDCEEEAAKKQKGGKNLQEERWLELAKLYRSLEEYDIVSGIFLDKLNVQGNAREAIRCESVLDWINAQTHYKSAIEADPDSLQNEFYKESYFSCLTKLSDWSELNNCIREIVNGNLSDLWNNFDLLPWFLKSEMMLSLKLDKNDFREILKKFSENKGKLKILNANFGEELAVFDWISDKLQKTNYRIDRLYLDFLTGWSHLNRWSYNLRLSKLASLQTVSELNFAVKTLAEERKCQMKQNFHLAIRHWEKNIPAPGDDLSIWDIKLTYRERFLKQIEDFSTSAIIVKSNLELAKTALSQNNINIAKEYLSRVKEKLHEVDSSLVAEYEYCFNLGRLVAAKQKMKGEKKDLRYYISIWRDISAKLSNSMESESEVSRISLFRCNTILGQVISELLFYFPKSNMSSTLMSSIDSLLGSKKTDVEALKNKGLEFFETAREISESVENNAELKSSAFLELAKYLLKFSALKPFPDFEQLAGCVLKAMKFGTAEARQLFGCLLNMSHLDFQAASIERLLVEIHSVPSWMFLMWINQILSGLQSSLFPFLKPIALQVTKDYPSAMWYPWRLNNKKFSSKNSELCLFSNELTNLLIISLSDKSSILYENFFYSMNYLGSPDLILRHHLENVLEEIEKNSNHLQINSTLTELHQLMFSSEYQIFRGRIFDYWDKFKDSIEELIMENQEQNVLKSKIESVLNSLNATELPFKRWPKLLLYSPWLSDFHSLKEDAKIEIPGQYDGDRKPIQKYIITITAFKENVLVFNSKCKPIRIAILGNDATEHKFLIKNGEDLRQDQRIQQIFRHFNQRLKENKLTKRFSVDTFKVIPLTFGLGMIEWIENNVSLHEMIENSLGNEVDLIAKAQTDHLMFLTQNSVLTDTEIVAAHLRAYDGIKRESAITNFKVRVQMFPQDLLKKSFWNLSTSPEHFIYLRENFAKSYAVMCVMHWLLGIGDRHLQNTLVSIKTGRVLGIDFGYAFGFATRFLTPPELIPFRLSPQILALMEPLNESGSIKQAMVHCLRVFRKQNFEMWSHLEVFALEPLMNWVERVKKDSRCNVKNVEAEYSIKDSSVIQQKLSGVNPVIGFEVNLLAGHSESNHLSKYLEVLKGVEQHNIRARCNRKGLSEEEQVECLIDLATDPHILAKTYIGWNPWL